MCRASAPSAPLSGPIEPLFVSHSIDHAVTCRRAFEGRPPRSIADATENALLLLIFNAALWANYAVNATTSPETNIACALHTADPGDAGSQDTSAITYSSYARVNVARTSGGW